MDRQYHFIAGLPRSGSTLLSAILRQNPRFKANMMSPVHGMAMGLINSWSSGKELAPLVNKNQKRRLIKATFNQYHAAPDKVVFDSNRGWTEKLPLINDLFPESKVICCVRNIAWVLDSFEKLYQQDPYEQTRLFPSDSERSTVYTRIRALAGPSRVVGYAAQSLKQAFYSELSYKLIIIEFDALVQQPEKTILKLYNLLGEDQYKHDFNDVSFEAQAFDANLGIPNLHTVRKTIKHTPRKSVLPPDLFKEFNGSNFWLQKSGSKAQFITL